MGLENRGAKTESSLNASYSIIENAATSQFPSVIAKGGFLDGDYEVLKTQEAIDKYAEGIMNGVIEYLGTSHSGYQATETTSKVATESIESKIKNMKYVTPETMDTYINSQDETEKKKALDVFTIDEEGNIVTATWSYANNVTQISKNSRTINLSTALEKYIVPFEYLLYFYIDTNEEDFSEALADEILNTEIVLAVEDNVTTVETTTTIQEKEVEDGGTTKDWGNKEEEEGKPNPSETISETCSTSVGFTYIDCWFVKAYRDNSYSEEILNMGDEDEIIIDIAGEVTETGTRNLSGETLVDSGTKASGEKDENGNDIMIEWERYERTITTTTTIRNVYSEGDLTTESKEKVFAKLYKENDMHNWVREPYLFYILNNNEKTKNTLLELTKYLIYKATGISYGVVEFDFSEYSLEAFTSISDFYGGTIQEKVWFALRNAGYSEIATAAVMGNIEHESHFDVTLVEGGYTDQNGGIGLCQWTNNKRGSEGRNTQLKAYAASKGVNWTDEQTQIEFLLAELTPGGGANGYASYALPARSSNRYDGTRYTKEDWTNSEDLDRATMAFMALFERPSYDPATNHIDRRRASAREYYEQFKGRTAPSGVSGSTIPVANGTSEQKLQYLFQNGTPTTASECQQYMQTISVALTTRDGTKTSGNLTIHRALVQDVQQVFQVAQDSGFKIYEAAGYSFRKMNNGGSGKLSHHSYGVAIDINVSENYSRRGNTIYAGDFWDPGRSEFSIPADGVLVKAFEAKGWKWGGNWSGNYQDYMHFSFTGN